ncbi:citrate synthase [Actinomadura parmotrematis]|uniref:citrate synthase (unknown stereospecificity) n=1 Tax=Actinomadura parmotrematis TaxID=2864039 RepID=A0ABS7FQ69_9ACTN|nr:citrate synthase [Actinomadura parmotrematis]MBW8482506.1 citrate synthase [Actinomadura parmotrematis]
MGEKDQAGEWIDAAAAAERLGVKPATLYAYVSRGVLRRRHAPDGRRSLFDAAQVEELARRGKPRRPPGPGEPAIESAITALGRDRPYYRGRDVLEMAGALRFEQVAAWLWTGGDGDGAGEWRAAPGAGAAVAAAQAALPAGTLPLDRLQLAVAVLGITDPGRHRLDPAGVTATGRALVAGLVEALPVLGPEPGAPDGSIAGRLWARLCPHPAGPGLRRALEAAMILLADHELAASTVAARVAASVRADPYAVAAAGIGAVSGPLHGAASYGVERLFAEIGGDPGGAAAAVDARLRAGERIPGFGHPVYKQGDARFGRLMDLVRAAAPDRLAVPDAVLAAAAARRLPAPNVDFAVAALGAAAGTAPGAGEAVFAIARTAGWLAHALEEYARRSPLRPRAVYTGPPVPA